MDTGNFKEVFESPKVKELTAQVAALEELAAKRLEEITKYRDAPVVVWRTHPYDYGIGHEGVYASTHFKEQSEAWKRKGWRVEELIVKPGEEK